MKADLGGQLTLTCCHAGHTAHGTWPTGSCQLPPWCIRMGFRCVPNHMPDSAKYMTCTIPNPHISHTRWHPITQMIRLSLGQIKRLAPISTAGKSHITWLQGSCFVVYQPCPCVLQTSNSSSSRLPIKMMLYQDQPLRELGSAGGQWAIRS